MTFLKTGSIIIVILLLLNTAQTQIVQVKVEQGWLRGEIKTTSTNLTKYNSFKGIPYAAPPVGNLRFKAPEPPLKWDGVRNATEHGPICLQPASYGSSIVIGDENCLYLNVYSPCINQDSLLPVMVFIHGGTYIIGSGNDDKYSPDFLMPFGVVLVTLNFRLGALGFLAIGTKEVPGNAGMKDQIAALQWVQKNIKKFGGNPNCVTIWGQGSGSAMVSFHVVSPAAKNLYKRAIAMSGTFFNDWSILFEPQRRAFALGRVLGLTTNNPQNLTTFLQSVPPEKIVLARPNIIISDNISNSLYITTYFTPNVEKKFGTGEGQYLTVQPTELMCNGQINQVDLMIGHTTSEGSRYTAENQDLLLNYYSQYKELLVPIKISLFRSPRKVLELADRVEDFYFNNRSISLKNINDFVNFESYFRYVFDIHAYLRRLPKLPCVRRYFYYFKIYTSRNVFARAAAQRYGIDNATHGDDLPYLFDGSFYTPKVEVNSNVFQYVQLMCTLFTNYAKYGNPTPDCSLGHIWPEYDPNRAFLTIGRNGSLSDGTIAYRNPILELWRDLYLSTGINIY